MGVALWLKHSDAENLGTERFMQTLLKLRFTELCAGNEIYECIIFKAFFLISQTWEQRHPAQQQKA